MKKEIISSTAKKKRLSKKGHPPGAAIYTGSTKDNEIAIEVFRYNKEVCHHDFMQVGEVLNLADDTNENRWINVNGVHDEKIVQRITARYNIHYLFQEDILNVFQRPKIEEEFNYLFLTFRPLLWNEAFQSIEEEQISAMLLANTVLTFQEHQGDGFDVIRERIVKDNSVLRLQGSDYLFYRILDITVDNYFEILEKVGDNLDEIETEIMDKNHKNKLYDIQKNKKDIMLLRKNIYPLRDVLNKLIKTEHPLITEKTRKYYTDVLDHTFQVIETIETYRDLNMALRDAYNNALSNEMNNIMKVLTIISTIFIPLTFIVGVYGMNFNYMPELDYRYGYPLVWLAMIIVTLILISWFMRKKWL